MCRGGGALNSLNKALFLGGGLPLAYIGTVLSTWVHLCGQLTTEPLNNIIMRKCNSGMPPSHAQHKPSTSNFSLRSICCIRYGNLHKQPLWKFQRWWSLVVLGCTRPPKGMWSLANSEANHQLKSLNFDDYWYISTMESLTPDNFFFRKLLFILHSHCKDIYLFSWIFYGSHFMAGYRYWLCKTKKTHTPLKWPDSKR